MKDGSQENRSYISLVCSHLDRILDSGTDTYGEEKTDMWVSSMDLRTGKYPEEDARPAHIGKRVYRWIDAPRGSSLYWDQPSIIAAHALTRITQDRKYADGANAYIKAFLERSVAKNGVFLWGNHYYYDVFRDQVIGFGYEPKPCSMETEEGHLHETRPIPPAWESFWHVSPEATERCIRYLGEAHVFDAKTGGFNRHADKTKGCAFLESGGILAEALCWLFTKTGDRQLVETALRIAGYSYGHRSQTTGLLENNPTHDRWDKCTCTTEVGLWATSLLRCFQMTQEQGFAEMAQNAVSAYLRYGYDQRAGAYYGRLQVADGKPILGEKVTTYQPREYAGIWEVLFPTHDYPMSLAESTLSLYALTGGEEFQAGARRWIQIIAKNMPAREGKGAYAEQYGRCIHFLVRASQVFGEAEYLELAHRLAEEATEQLFAFGMFRGHPGEDRYDAVDGVGYLALALLYLETGEPPDMMGSGF